LNLYAALSDEIDPIGNVPWFSYERKFVRLDQERFLAEVDPTLFENVQTIVNELASTFKAQGFFTEPPADLPLHVPNIPTKYHSDQNLVQILTVKKDYEQGNVQLTPSFLRVDNAAVHLLDCDMDEHRNIVLHSFDIVNHMVTGGTSPISMHEYIVRDSSEAAANGIPPSILATRWSNGASQSTQSAQRPPSWRFLCAIGLVRSAAYCEAVT